MRLDHLSYVAGPEGLAACVQRLGARLGAGFTDGGIHPVLRHSQLRACRSPTAATSRSSRRSTIPPSTAHRSAGPCATAPSEGGGWLAWVIGVDDIAPIEQRLSRIAAAGHRRRPDGVDLRWPQIGVNDVAIDPQLPFFVQWDVPEAESTRPAGARGCGCGGSRSPVTSTRIDDYLGDVLRQPLDGVDVDWVDQSDDGTGVVAAVFDTASGPVRID